VANNISTKQFLSIAEFAELLCISKKTIYNRRSAGFSMPPAIKVPNMRGLFYSLDNINTWLESNTELKKPVKNMNVPKGSM